jgi:hypothetical protein
MMGQVVPETCRDFEPQLSDSESEVYQVGCVYYVIVFCSAFTQVDAKLYSPTKKTEAVSVLETSEYTHYPT